MNVIKNPNTTEQPHLCGLSWTTSPGTDFCLDRDHMAPELPVRLENLARVFLTDALVPELRLRGPETSLETSPRETCRHI